MTRWSKTICIRSILAGALVVTALSWGVFATLWTFPNDTGSIITAVLQGENLTITFNSIANVTPGSQAQYALFFQTKVQPGVGVGVGSYKTPEGYAFGPFYWATLNSTWLTSEVRYVVFSSFFTSTLGPGSETWHTGPQGNLSVLLHRWIISWDILSHRLDP